MSRQSTSPRISVAQTYQTATTLHRQGKLDEAVELYRAVLREERDHFDALNNLGTLRARQGFSAEAERLFQRALKQRPESVEAHHNLALALRALNRHEAAQAHSEQAEVLRARRAAVASGNLQEAERWYQDILARDPRSLEALLNLGRVYLVTGKRHEATTLLERAVKFWPDSPDAHNSLGVTLRALERQEEAERHFRRALALNPNHAEAHANLGNTLASLRRFEEALGSFQRALALKPNLAAAHSDSARVLRTLGRLDEARQAFETAIRLDPRQPNYYHGLAEFKRFTADDPHLAALEGLAQGLGSLSFEQQMELHFTLGKAYADLGRHVESFNHLLEGNRLAKQRIVYDEAQALGQLERTRAVFTHELMREKADAGDPTDMPIFILGMPRSGSTLIEQILASHPMVTAGGELEDFREAVAQVDGPDGTAMDYPEGIPRWTADDLRALAARYRESVTKIARGAARVTDKLPGNFLRAGLIPLTLPNARIIHTRRDPLDTCLSCFAILFSAGTQRFTYDLAELGRYYRSYERLMAHWREVLPAGVMLEVDYEEVVADIEGQARRIVAHCGLPWDDACLEFHRARTTVYTASSVQVRQPLYRSSVARARPYRHLLGPLLEELGLADEANAVSGQD